MNSHRLAAFGTWLVGFIIVDPAPAITYNATLLNVPGFYSHGEAHGVSGGSQVGWASGSGTAFHNHARLWSGTAANAVDLHPSGFWDTYAEGASGSSQVGWGYGPVTRDAVHGLLWQGTAGSVVDLNPPGFMSSRCDGVSENMQVGSGGPIGGSVYDVHALLWSGTAESAVDLHPAGFDSSTGRGISGGTQVGIGHYGPFGAGNVGHALLWYGTAESVVDLNPAGFDYSAANGVSGNSQVGASSIEVEVDGGGVSYVTHATMWAGTAASMVDLHPTGFDASEAQAVSESGQVGFGISISGQSTIEHALFWRGTAESVVDLHSFLVGLPVALTGSRALGIDNNGTIVGFGFDINHASYAILWTPVAEPNSLALCGGVIALPLVTRRQRQSNPGIA